jgi:hypothetical protein
MGRLSYHLCLLEKEVLKLFIAIRNISGRFQVKGARGK